MKRTNVVLALCCGLAFALGCATGTEDLATGDDGLDPDAMGSHVTIDANASLPIDARPIDASLPIDAAPLPIDANTPSLLPIGSSCTTSSQCESACCLAGFNACFEDPGFGCL